MIRFLLNLSLMIATACFFIVLFAWFLSPDSAYQDFATVKSIF